MRNRRHALGRSGERAVRRYYEALGGRVLAVNYRRRPLAEVDLIVEHGGEVAFVEIKTRSEDGDKAWGGGWEAVPAWKRRRIERAALAFDPRLPVRFDVAVVVGARVEVLEDAWEARDAL